MIDSTSVCRKFDLEERLVDFAVQIIALAESLPSSKTGSHIAGQLVRSETSPTLNYGEAQSAESRSDFIHNKMKIVLKELRETSISLKIVKRTGLAESTGKLTSTTNECHELIAIFAKSLQTAEIQRRRR
jgi:four helix bundle protein